MFQWKMNEKHHSRCINEKLIHFIQWCLRILGLNSLHKWLRKLLGYSLGARVLWTCTISIFLYTDGTSCALSNHCANYTHTNNVSSPLFQGVANKCNSQIFKVLLTLKGVNRISVFWTCISTITSKKSFLFVFLKTIWVSLFVNFLSNGWSISFSVELFVFLFLSICKPSLHIMIVIPYWWYVPCKY